MRNFKSIEAYGLVKVYSRSYNTKNAGKVIESSRYLLVITKDEIHQTVLCMYPNGYCEWVTNLELQETASGYIAPRCALWYNYLPMLNAFYVAYDNGKNHILVDMINKLAPDIAVRFKNRHAAYYEHRPSAIATAVPQEALPKPEAKTSCHNRDVIVEQLITLQETLDTCKITIDTLLRLV